MGSFAEETMPEAECAAFMKLALEQVLDCPLSSYFYSNIWFCEIQFGVFLLFPTVDAQFIDDPIIFNVLKFRP